MNIFEFMYDTFKFNKDNITLFESFAGVGSQAMALKLLAKEKKFTLETVGISEIDKYAIASYNAIHGETKNYGSICDIQEIPQVDIFTYSFPCQDISLAGNQKGFTKGSGTRSGLLWEVERLLENQHKLGKLPQVLLMENVKALAGIKFVDDFNKWQLKLQELGYSNYWQILNAKDYGIPQNRERVFMVSILGENNYNFPKPFELKLRLKDMLEDEVEDKYYLSDKMLQYITSFDKEEKENGSKTYKVSQGSLKIDRDVAVPITTREGNTRADCSNYVSERSNVICYLNYYNHDMSNRVYDIHTHAPTLRQRMGDYAITPKILLPEATKKGYAEASNGDGVYINRPHQKRGVVQKGMIQTLKTGQDVGVVDNLRIRKLTPKECWRLMGFSDKDFNAAQQVCSNTQLYKQAGNSIVLDVLYYIFKELL